MTSRWFIQSLLGVVVLLTCGAATVVGAEPVKYCRFQAGDTIAYGLVEGERVRELDGVFGKWQTTDKTHPLKSVTLLVPCQPTQVLALAGNYVSHLAEENTVTTTITTVTQVTNDVKAGTTTTDSKTTTEVRKSGEVPEKLKIPQPFFKSPSCLLADGGEIVLPKHSTVVHYEAELVIVIGRRAKNVSKESALDYVFGVTAGNDVSERAWQKGDVQWWRAKGADTFGPCGPFIVSGLNYDDLMLELRVNGKTLQKERTSQMIHGVAATVSFISQHITLHPGDLIYTGTSGQTDVIKAGDVVEVELEGVGVLTNKVVADK